MTKQAELEILRDAVAKLGPDSYCGPWLASVLQEVERDMRCDILPAATMGDTAKQCAELVKVAEERAAEIVRNAEGRADLIVAAAEAKRQGVLSIRDRVAGVIHGAERELWNI